MANLNGGQLQVFALGQLDLTDPCFVNQLPDEMLLEIFKRLDKVDSMASVRIRRCCRRWNHLLRNPRISKKLFLDITPGSLFLHLLFCEGSKLKIICPNFTKTAIVFTRGEKVVHDLDSLFSTGCFIRDCQIRRLIFSHLEFNMLSFCELLIILGLFQWTEALYLEFYHCDLRLAMGYLQRARIAALNFSIRFDCCDVVKMSTEEMYVEFLRAAFEGLDGEEIKAIHDLLRYFWRYRGGFPWAKAMKKLLNMLYQID